MASNGAVIRRAVRVGEPSEIRFRGQVYDVIVGKPIQIGELEVTVSPSEHSGSEAIVKIRDSEIAR